MLRILCLDRRVDLAVTAKTFVASLPLEARELLDLDAQPKLQLPSSKDRLNMITAVVKVKTGS